MGHARWTRLVGWIGVGLSIAVAMALVFGGATMWLWNLLMPKILGLPEISYWQAVGLLLLSHLLFKGHHHCDGSRRPLKTPHPLSPHNGSQAEERAFAKRVRSMMQDPPPTDD